MATPTEEPTRQDRLLRVARAAIDALEYPAWLVAPDDGTLVHVNAAAQGAALVSVTAVAALLGAKARRTTDPAAALCEILSDVRSSVLPVAIDLVERPAEPRHRLVGRTVGDDAGNVQLIDLRLEAQPAVGTNQCAPIAFTTPERLPAGQIIQSVRHVSAQSTGTRVAAAAGAPLARLQDAPHVVPAPRAGKPVDAADRATLDDIARRIMSGDWNAHAEPLQSMGPGHASDQAFETERATGSEPESRSPSRSLVPPPPATGTLGAISAAAGARSSERAVQRSDTSLATAVLAHELRTPLSAIATLAEIIRDAHYGEQETQRYRAYAGDIATTALHALALVADYADAARVEAEGDGSLSEREQRPTRPLCELGATLALARRPDLRIDVGVLVNQTAQAMAGLAKAKSVRLDVSTDDGLETAAMDPRALRQVLFNLISNAIKFSRQGGFVRIGARPGRGGSVLVFVRDTGPGMSQHQILTALGQGNLFPETSERPAFATGQGQGLGLKIVGELAQSTGCTLAIESRPKRGSTVILVLPRVTEALGLETQAQRDESPIKRRLARAQTAQSGPGRAKASNVVRLKRGP
ncbi:MAG: sensor histidine kinase [Hyphomicrobiaceae bacterium]